MTTFTIDNDNQIMGYRSAEDAKSNPQAQQFTSAKQLVKLAEKWPAARLVELWNALPGQKPVKKLSDRKAAVARIWAAIQSVAPDSQSMPTAGATQSRDGAPQAPAVAPGKAKESKQSTPPAKPANAPKAGKAPKPEAPEATKTSVAMPSTVVPEHAAKPAKAPRARKTPASEVVEPKTRARSKTAHVLDLLKRPGGATLKNIMEDTGWQAHSVRGFISGTLGAKMGLTVESAKGEGGERTYSLKG